MNPKNPEAIRTQILALVKEYYTAKFAPKSFDPDKDLVHYAGRVFDAEGASCKSTITAPFVIPADAGIQLFQGVLDSCFRRSDGFVEFCKRLRRQIIMPTQQGQLKPEETEKRNMLKNEKPYVYDKIMKYDEKVKKGESIAILQFQYDYKCNFRCQHCDIMPCPYIHVSLGNFFEEPLKDIIERGTKIKYFKNYVDTCLIAEDRDFLNNIEAKKIYGKPVPVPYTEVFTGEDFID